MAEENKPLLRRQKGWRGYVHSYNNYCENGSYDEMDWGHGTKDPKTTEIDKMGKVIQKW